MTSARRERSARRDDAAMSLIARSRALNASYRPPRGDVYVIAGERYVVHRVNSAGVTLRAFNGRKSYLMSECTGPIDPARWTPTD